MRSVTDTSFHQHALLFFFPRRRSHEVTVQKELCLLGFCVSGVLRFIYTPPPLFPGQVLRDSGVFEYTWKELSIWLEHLDNTKEDQKEAVIQFLERVTMFKLAG